MYNVLTKWKYILLEQNNPYKAAVINGFEGTEDEWYEYISHNYDDPSVWDNKNNKLGWVTKEDIDNMFNDNYKSSVDESIKFSVTDGSLIIQKGVGD